MKDVDVKKIVGEVAARHGVLIDENDPLMVALTANGLVLEALARELLTESRAVVEKLESASVALPEETRAALAQAADSASDEVGRNGATGVGCGYRRSKPQGARDCGLGVPGAVTGGNVDGCGSPSACCGRRWCLWRALSPGAED